MCVFLDQGWEIPHPWAKRKRRTAKRRRRTAKACSQGLTLLYLSTDVLLTAHLTVHFNMNHWFFNLLIIYSCIITPNLHQTFKQVYIRVYKLFHLYIFIYIYTFLLPRMHSIDQEGTFIILQKIKLSIHLMYHGINNNIKQHSCFQH